MDYTIVTAWYDIRDKENNPYKGDDDMKHFCTTEYYLSSVKKMFEKPFPLIIFTEPKYEKKMMEIRPKELHHITRFIVRDYDQLNLYFLYNKYKENHENNVICNLHTEKFTSLYKFLVLQKPDFVKQAVMMNPFNTSKFAWMDMRLHDVYDMQMHETDRVFMEFSPDRVHMMQMEYTCPSEIENRSYFYSYTRGKIAAGFFGGYSGPLINFANLCKEEIEYCCNNGFAPTDEMIFSYVVGKNQDLFYPYVGDYSSVLKNILYIREYLYLALRFLEESFQKGSHFYTSKITESIRIGYLKGEFNLSNKEVYDVWYYGYVSNYWLNKKEKCKNLLEELYEIACLRKDVSDYIKSIFDFFKYMISYIEDKELVNKFDKFK